MVKNCKSIQENGLFFALLSNDSCLNRLKEIDLNFENFIKPHLIFAHISILSKMIMEVMGGGKVMLVTI